MKITRLPENDKTNGWSAILPPRTPRPALEGATDDRPLQLFLAKAPEAIMVVIFRVQGRQSIRAAAPLLIVDSWRRDSLLQGLSGLKLTSRWLLQGKPSLLRIAKRQERGEQGVAAAPKGRIIPSSPNARFSRPMNNNNPRPLS